VRRENSGEMFSSFFKEKRVLVTGHTGFKGAWLSLWLRHLGAKVFGISLPPPTAPNLHELINNHVFTREITCDTRDLERLAPAILATDPEVIFHLAGQAISRRSYQEPLETFQTNVNGTLNVLESVRRARLNCVVIVITSDKCYENREWEFAYRENDALGGHDVYSMSKAAAELATQAWKKSFFLTDPKLGPVATVRAGNVIGGGDYAPDRIVPDCVRALIRGEAIQVRNPSATRPWQHVLACLSGYLWLAVRLHQEPNISASWGGTFNFGPDGSGRQTVGTLVQEFLKSWPGKWIDASDPKAPHEAKLLSLSIEKAGALLGWYPCWTFAQTVQQTAAWYYQRHVAGDPNILQLSIRQIEDYSEVARAKSLAWAASA